jgi:hypothetical protein
VSDTKENSSEFVFKAINRFVGLFVNPLSFFAFVFFVSGHYCMSLFDKVQVNNSPQIITVGIFFLLSLMAIVTITAVCLAVWKIENLIYDQYASLWNKGKGTPAYGSDFSKKTSKKTSSQPTTPTP